MHQGSYKHTIDDIRERTGLSRHFINRCSSKISDILDPYRQYGDNNQLFYDDSGLMIFDQIGQLKQEGKTIPEIRERLLDGLQSPRNGSQSGRKTLQNDLQDLQLETTGPEGHASAESQFVAAIKDAYQEVSRAKDKVIESKDETIGSLQQNLRLLTDGRDPEKVKEEYKEKTEQAAKRRQEIEQLKEEKQREQKQQRRRKQRRHELLAELKTLEGKWFKSSRREEIIAELERLDREAQEEE
jgi:hypothetical protein